MNKFKILIIEDEASIQLVYKEIFEMEGFVVFRAETGAKGLSLAKNEVPNLILLDVMLPGGMNGFKVLEELKRDPTLASIPVVVISNLDSERDTALELGAADYIIKANQSVSDLVKKVRKYVQ